MQHGNRIKVVRGIHIRVQKEYNNLILFGGVYGSTAIGRDTEFSDIEMMYVLREGSPSKNKTFLYQGIPIEVNFISIDSIQQWLDKLHLFLPLQMGNLANLQLLAGDNKQRDEILAAYRNLSQEKIIRFFHEHGAEIAYESLNKIRSIPRRGNKRERQLFVFEAAQEISLALALINRMPVTRGYYTGIKESYEFEQIPDNYKELVEVFLGTEEVKDSIEAGQNLLASYEQFLVEQGMKIFYVKTLDEIDFRSTF